MVLSGTLKEFILADVFNLLTQQKDTGKLVLTCDKSEGGIVFSDGFIIGAECGEEDLPNKLFNYLVDIKGRTPEELTPLFNSNAGNLNALCAAAVERGLLLHKELQSFAGACVEDICCSLLAWKHGSYRFNSQRNVTTQTCGAVKISVENIIMEGMRRTDEWARMREYIHEEAIFVPASKKGAGLSADAPLDPAAAPEEYVLTLLDGSSTVKTLVKGSCLCEYKIYESIHVLLQSQRITALQRKYTQPIQAALKRKNAEEASVLGSTLKGSLISGGIAAAIIALLLLARFVLLPTAGVNIGGVRESRAPVVAESERLLRQATSGTADIGKSAENPTTPEGAEDVDPPINDDAEKDDTVK